MSAVPDQKRALQTMAQSFTYLKRERCRERGGPTDLVPMIHLIFDTGDHEVAVLLDDRETIPPMIQSMSAGQTLAYVGFLTDAYHRDIHVPRATLDDRDELGALLHGRGETAAAFHAGDLTVTEMLVVLLLDVGRDTLHEVHTPYTYRDDGLPRFAKPVRHNEPGIRNLGRVGELVRMGAGLIDHGLAPDDVIDAALAAFNREETT